MFDVVDARQLAMILMAGVFGGFVRGYSGFGFALASMPVLTLALSPSVAVPAVFPLEFAIGLLTLPVERTHVDLGVLKWLALGAVVGTPLGMTVLALVPAEIMRLVLGLAVAVAVVRAWRGETTAMAQSRAKLTSIGFLSGCLNGGTAMSGPPVIVSLLSSNMPVLEARATLIAFIAMSAGFGMLLSASHGGYSREIWWISLAMAPAAALGCGLGVLAFKHVPKRFYHPASLSLLAAAMSLAIVTASLAVLHKLTL
ncbi:MAG TPA: sulfite exporter TauE/SafE family protein [Rhodopseudomonas sp.]|uniref:sulfite exporter TauE/SafE family protein n=1 Tax=Rhodopseudomonas sp. TaxID=1078 RepID=UPI002EDA668D